jgi:hypothetical protein
LSPARSSERLRSSRSRLYWAGCHEMGAVRKRPLRRLSRPAPVGQRLASKAAGNGTDWEAAGNGPDWEAAGNGPDWEAAGNGPDWEAGLPYRRGDPHRRPGARNHRSGAGTPRSGAGTPRSGAGTPRSGAGTPGAGSPGTRAGNCAASVRGRHRRGGRTLSKATLTPWLAGSDQRNHLGQTRARPTWACTRWR